MELSAASEVDLTGVVAGDDAPEVFLVDLLDVVTVADAVEAALAPDLLDADEGGV